MNKNTSNADVNGDGKVAADVNKDGVVDQNDLSFVAQKLLGQ
ncbi:dockerin type I domain-containing protein [Paenibacillus elgii]